MKRACPARWFVVVSVLCGLGGIVGPGLPVTASAASNRFIAYNDLVHDPANGHPTLTPNVTTFNIGSGAPGPSSGILIDKNTGLPTGVTVTLTQSGGVHWQSSATTGGSDCGPGTDARNIFDPASSVSLMGTVYYGDPGWWVDITFTGLDPARRYEFVTTANRNDPSYTTRITRYTISGADGFTNVSSPGTTIEADGASTVFNTGYNTQTGYVAWWVDIDPGPDGSFKVRAEAATSDHRAYAFDAFMLAESGAANNVQFVPRQLSAVVGAADVAVTLKIPPEANASNPVTVTLVSDRPDVAEPKGAGGQPFTVTLPAGGPNEQTVTIGFGSAGQARISTANDAGLNDVVLTVDVEAGSVNFTTPALIASPSSTTPVTIRLTPGSNATRPVNVTLISDDPEIAVPANAVDDRVVLHFAPGAPTEQTVDIRTEGQGETHLRTTNDGGLTDAVLPVSVRKLDYIQVVVNPYESVDWAGFQRHKANVHTHTTQSDGSLTPDQVIDEYKARGYSVLAITDHNRCTFPWENWNRYPDLLNMLAIPGNEASEHHHLNALFINFTTGSTNVDLTLTQIGLAGGLAVLNHPGRYNYTVQDYVNWYRTFDHLVAMEVINQGGRFIDLPLWDQVLSIMMPDRPVWGVAADDMHSMSHLGRDWLTYLVPPAASETETQSVTGWEDRPWMQSFLSDTAPDGAVVRQATERGQYYFSSVGTHPTAVRSVAETPVIDSILVDHAAGTITVSASSGGQPLPADKYRWVSMASEVQVGPTINYRTTPGVDKYVRAELIGQGGTTFTNPFGIAYVGPTLALSTKQITRDVHIRSTLANDTFTIANSGPDSLSYIVTSDAPWLTVAPTEGDSSGEEDTITVSYATVALPVGQHQATITVTSAEAGNSPQTVQVTVNVRTVAPDLDHDGDVDQSDFGLFQLCLGKEAGVPGCQASDFNGSGFIDTFDVNTLLNCLSGAGNLATPGCDH
ncbi:MAG TPA: hypothetical protein PK458_19140 [Phycisphaerae bacterium]|nr:hypothetical protein [Phycisphaerae bacterium]HOM52437.1 hypothetical protein [Phycisphaerae bacterium]HPP27711.1 hypothetical protein [Phycisphaerae bacterium]HPU28301.1 hypothetical protein [Phycisphaerae bacterium]